MEETEGGVEMLTEDDSIIVQLVNKIITDAHQKNSSDIHIEPYPGKEGVEVRLRRNPLKPDHVCNVVWKPAVKKAELEKRPLMQTRHTFAPTMLPEGEPSPRRINLIPQHPRTLEHHHSSGINCQVISGCRVPAPSW
jgi:hypothetical protein